LRQVSIELELHRTTKNDSGDIESTKKVEMLVAEMQSERTKTKEELLNLRERNKVLVQKTAHERQHREQLLREISELKSKVSELTPKVIHIESPNLDNIDSFEEDKSKVVGFSLPSPMHWRTQQHMQKYRNRVRLSYFQDDDYDFGLDEEVDVGGTSEEDDISF